MALQDLTASFEDDAESKKVHTFYEGGIFRFDFFSSLLTRFTVLAL